MKKLFLIAILIGVLLNIIHAQQENKEVISPIELNKTRFAGTVKNGLIFRELKTWDLYKLIENPQNIDGNYHYSLFKRGNTSYNENNIRKKVSYIKNDYIVYFKVIRSSTKPYTYENEVFMEYPGGEVVLAPYQLFHYCMDTNTNTLFFIKNFTDSDHPKYSDGDFIAKKIWYVDLNNPNPKPAQLPIRGQYMRIIDSYLYFYDYYNRVAYDRKYNLYKVKIGEWDNIEMVFRQTYSIGYIYPNQKLLFASIVIDHKPVNIIYNTKTQSYARLDENDIYNTGKTIKNTSSTSGAYFYSEKYDAAYLRGKTRLHYITNLPEEYPHKFREVRGVLEDGTNGIHYQGYESFDDLPKKVNLSLPITEKEKRCNFPRPPKPFSGTFITDELLYETNKEKLSSLSKKKLRLLRNAFFARLGYSFESKDLQEFFMQFDWYVNSLDRKKMTNNKIIIPPEDKERIQLILELEKDK
ncbi:MAG: YARHG domain-containing protein [Bacteroidota bacterium]